MAAPPGRPSWRGHEPGARGANGWSEAARDRTEADEAAFRGGASGWGPSRARRASGRYGAGLQVRADLALHALEGVVHRLCVAGQPLADLLVGVAVQVQREHAALELRQRPRQTADQRAQLVRGDDLVDRIVHGGPRQRLIERGHVLARAGWGR